MMDKIELYREVLAIEPNSKVFFPLARALAEVGRRDEAIAVLETGIGFHPDHLEAKFLLVEIYSGMDREDDAVRVFTGVRDSLVRYPSVWRLWSRHAGFASPDPVLALSFLAQFFRDPSLTFAGVFEKGLEALGGAAPAEAVPSPPPTAQAPDVEPPAQDLPAAEPVRTAAVPPSVVPEPVVPEPVVPEPVVPEPVIPEPIAAEAVDDATAEAAPEAPAPETARPVDDPTAMSLRGADEVRELTGLLGMEAEAEPLSEADREPVAAVEGPEASATTQTVHIPDLGIRTRTMASLLAAQGDVQGALDIYAELLARLPAGPDRDEVGARLAELTKGAVAPAPVPAPEPQPAETPGKPRGKAKLIGLLDALAGRLEARSRA